MADNYVLSKFFRSLIVFILSLLIFSSLASSDLFINKTLTPFYLYVIEVSIILIFTGIMFLFEKKGLQISNTIFIVILLVGYILVHGLFITKNLSPFGIYLILSFLLLLSIYCLFFVFGLKTAFILNIIIIVASGESLICVMQYLKLIHSLNIFFKVTGTWENPNVTAMFIAMSAPSLFFWISSTKKALRNLSWGAFSLFIVALLLLACRTAFIGAAFSVLLLLNYKYKVSKWIFNKENSSLKFLLFIIFAAIIIPVCGYVYNAKKASSDGRKLIWKLSAEMILRKPVMGYGYGTFERNYNLFQSGYFRNGEGTDLEMQNAGFAKMGYNEFLQNAVEGGLIGFLLFSMLLLSLLLVPVSKENKNILPNSPNLTHLSLVEEERTYLIAYAGIVVFSVMSFFNFSIQAVPVMTLFVMYASVVSFHPANTFNPFSFRKTNPANGQNIGMIPKWIVGVALLSAGLFMGFTNIEDAHASRLNKRAALDETQGDYKAAFTILRPLEPRLNNYEGYWVNYAKTCQENKDYAGAIIRYNKAKLLTSNPEVYLRCATCYEKTGDFVNAERDLLIAKNMEPNHIRPRVELMSLYISLKDTINSVRVAREIILIKPKVISEETNKLKNMAITYLKQQMLPVGQADEIKKRKFVFPIYN